MAERSDMVDRRKPICQKSGLKRPIGESRWMVDPGSRSALGGGKLGPLNMIVAAFKPCHGIQISHFRGASGKAFEFVWMRFHAP